MSITSSQPSHYKDSPQLAKDHNELIKATFKPALFYELIMRIVYALISMGIIYLGYRLFIMGVTGEASLSVNSTTVSGQLLNASPGLFFAVGGIISFAISIIKGSSFRVTLK